MFFSATELNIQGTSTHNRDDDRDPNVDADTEQCQKMLHPCFEHTASTNTYLLTENVAVSVCMCTVYTNVEFVCITNAKTTSTTRDTTFAKGAARFAAKVYLTFRWQHIFSRGDTLSFPCDAQVSHRCRRHHHQQPVSTVASSRVGSFGWNILLPASVGVDTQT